QCRYRDRPRPRRRYDRRSNTCIFSLDGSDWSKLPFYQVPSPAPRSPHAAFRGSGKLLQSTSAMPQPTDQDPDFPPLVLTFAASDPSGGAGVQADILTLASMGCHPLSVITAITVQDTLGV